jgi:hypothetical protein
MNSNFSEAMKVTGNWEVCQYRVMKVMLKGGGDFLVSP